MRHCVVLGLVMSALAAAGCGDRGGQAAPSSSASGEQTSPELTRARSLIQQISSPRGTPNVRSLNDLTELAEENRKVASLAIPAIRRLLDNESPGIRVLAIRSLGEIGDARAYRSPDLQGIGHPILEDREALPALVKALADPSEAVRQETPRQLGKIAELNVTAAEQIVLAILPLLGSKDDSTREAAAEAIEKVADRLARTRKTLDGSQDPEAPLRSREISALIGPAISPLEKLTASPNDRVQDAAKKALTEIKTLE